MFETEYEPAHAALDKCPYCDCERGVQAEDAIWSCENILGYL